MRTSLARCAIVVLTGIGLSGCQNGGATKTTPVPPSNQAGAGPAPGAGYAPTYNGATPNYASANSTPAYVAPGAATPDYAPASNQAVQGYGGATIPAILARRSPRTNIPIPGQRRQRRQTRTSHRRTPTTRHRTRTTRRRTPTTRRRIRTTRPSIHIRRTRPPRLGQDTIVPDRWPAGPRFPPLRPCRQGPTPTTVRAAPASCAANALRHQHLVAVQRQQPGDWHAVQRQQSGAWRRQPDDRARHGSCVAVSSGLSIRRRRDSLQCRGRLAVLGRQHWFQHGESGHDRRLQRRRRRVWPAHRREQRQRIAARVQRRRVPRDEIGRGFGLSWRPAVGRAPRAPA